MSPNSGYCLAHGLITLHLRTAAGEQDLPAAFYEGAAGQEALRRAGPRVQRVSRWDGAGWQTWWTLLALLAGGQLAVAALPRLDGPAELSLPFPTAYILPPTIAVRAASPLPTGTAIYLGAFAGEVASFGPAGMDDPQAVLPGLETLYRTVVAAVFRQERRPLLALEVPALLHEGHTADVSALLRGLDPFLGAGPVVLGGEDSAVVAALARALQERSHEVAIVDPLAGLERLVWAAGGLG